MWELHTLGGYVLLDKMLSPTTSVHSANMHNYAMPAEPNAKPFMSEEFILAAQPSPVQKGVKTKRFPH